MKFAEHGENTGPHRDGWGVVFYEGNDVHRIREARAAADSDWVRFIARHHLASSLVIAHLRSATRGEQMLANTHPFTRELAGHMHVFAHNGDLPTLIDAPTFQPRHYRPLGTTDSELAFCTLMDRLYHLWNHSPSMPPMAERLAIITAFAAELRDHGPANFLYADGEYLFAHAHRRTQAATQRIEPPGLYMLNRHCQTAPSSDTKIHGLSIKSSDNTIILLASVPLSQEAWRPLDEGEIVVVKDGNIALPSS